MYDAHTKEEGPPQRTSCLKHYRCTLFTQKYSDYQIHIDEVSIPQGVTMERKL